MSSALQYNDELPCHLSGDETLTRWAQRLFRERELNGSTLVEMYEQESALDLSRAPAPEHAVGQINFLVDAGWVEFPEQTHHGFGANYMFRARYDCDAAQVYLSDKWKACPACGTTHAFVELHHDIVCLRCQDCKLKGSIKGWYEQKPHDQRQPSQNRFNKRAKPKPPAAVQAKPVVTPIKILSAPRPDFTKKPMPQTSIFDMHLEGDR